MQLNRLGRLLTYYRSAILSEESLLQHRLTFDNLLIGKKERNIAERFLRADDNDLVWGKEEQNYRARISSYLDTSVNQTFLLFTAHSALFLVLSILKKRFPNKKKVVVAGFTCTVIVNSIVACGLEPIFVDIETQTYGLDLEQLQDALTENGDIVAVVHQHLFGLVAINHERILELCKGKQIPIVADCAQSLGTRYHGKSIGLDEDFAFFSTQASKSLNTFTGGILITKKYDQDVEAEFRKIPYPDVSTVQRILRAYIAFAKLKTVNWSYLPAYRRIVKRHLVPSLHPSELANYDDFRAWKSNTEGAVYLAKFPNALCSIGLVQLGRIDHFLKVRKDGKAQIEKRFGIEARVLVGSEPSYLRIPAIKDELYKRDSKFDNGYLVGNWFPYSFGRCPNSRRLAKTLVNYVKADRCYLEL